MQPSKKPLTRPGFTLFEVMIVMIIIFVVAALASPLVFQAMHSDTRVNAAADMVRARWADCRYQAMEQGRPYQFSVVPNSGKFKVEPYNDASDQQATLFLADVDTSPNQDRPPFMNEDTLPEGVRFGTKDHPVDPESDEATDTNYVPIAVFWPDGTAQNDVEITFGTKGGGIMTIRLNAATGAATMVRPDVKEAGK